MYYILILQIIFVSCQDFPLYNTDDMIIENLRKREVIPLNQINRRLFRSNEQIRYRRTKDVQEDLAERKLDKIYCKATLLRRAAQRLAAAGKQV
ncbi:hypothetical protein O3G_MSEX005263 [Manduca sexta]|uniref:Uncharacterized protein n=1 Tax=Manduca sexta TaxID=7130 RepID=A0A921YYY9_MANSE|nr:hypothetical protein O3G_MSEX005263 [Manduca sexta]